MKFLVKIALIFFSIGLSAQHPDTSLDSLAFDFWVGSWDLSWDNANGTKGSGKNVISKILDDRIIQENFSSDTGFKGTSITVFDSKRKIWHQAWADNQDGYYDFIGEIKEDSKIFKTMGRIIKDKKLIERMVFHHIQKDSFVWDWEASQDGGNTWNLSWRINYLRSR